MHSENDDDNARIHDAHDGDKITSAEEALARMRYRHAPPHPFDSEPDREAEPTRAPGYWTGRPLLPRFDGLLVLAVIFALVVFIGGLLLLLVRS